MNGGIESASSPRTASLRRADLLGVGDVALEHAHAADVLAAHQRLDRLVDHGAAEAHHHHLARPSPRGDSVASRSARSAARARSERRPAAEPARARGAGAGAARFGDERSAGTRRELDPAVRERTRSSSDRRRAWTLMRGGALRGKMSAIAPRGVGAYMRRAPDADRRVPQARSRRRGAAADEQNGDLERAVGGAGAERTRT